MKKVIIIPRNRLENESLEEYKTYLKEIYFDSERPSPLTRYDFACSQNLPDTYEAMDGKDGAYTKYLEKYYKKYYKKLDRKVNKAVRKYERKDAKINKVASGMARLYSKVSNIKLPKFKLDNSKIKSIIAKINKLQIREKAFKKVTNISFYIILLVTLISLVTFFTMKNAIGLIIGIIGILASKPLAPERKTKEEKEAKKAKKSKNKSKISFKKIKEGLAKVFAKKKTPSEPNTTIEAENKEDLEKLGFDTSVEEENITEEKDISFDVTTDEIEIIKDTEEIHVEPEVVFDTRTTKVETVVNPEVVTEKNEIDFDTTVEDEIVEEQDFAFDVSVPDYNLNEGQVGKLEPNSFTVPNTKTKLSIYLPNFFKEKRTKSNSEQHVKVMKK